MYSIMELQRGLSVKPVLENDALVWNLKPLRGYEYDNLTSKWLQKMTLKRIESWSGVGYIALILYRAPDR